MSISISRRMSLSIGSGSGGFSPASIFTASEPGLWGDVRPSVLWQDTARTTPVTADGDPVASWEVRTASGAAYWTQATALNRPTYRTSGGLHWLEFDGTTDSLVSPTITPGTDKVQVFVGVRKASDAAQGNLLEHSATIGGNNGGFRITAPDTAANNYTFRSKGTAIGTVTVSGFAAPVTSVLTAIGDIGADITRMSVNGGEAFTDGGDQGTGNYLAYPMYLGGRGGAAVFFSGNVYSLIVRFGATLSAAHIASAERWTAARSGVAL